MTHEHRTMAFRLAIILVLGSGLLAAQEKKPEPAVSVEHVTQKPKRDNQGLGTTFYAPSTKEKPFFDKLASSERVTGGLLGEYDISKKDGKYVGWFGVVRKVEEDKEKNQTVLLCEHKYFDGFTDTHILALSFNGSGDFEVVVPGVGHKLELLTLVKAYGTVSMPKDKTEPQLAASFLRNWHWGTFTFLLAAGEQKGSEQWRKLNKVDLDDIYNPYPDDRYYEQRLGKRKPATAK
jgi:hypothetical protein